MSEDPHSHCSQIPVLVSESIQSTIGLHSKHFIVDDKCCYIGSQNLYLCDLAEWGIVVDHEEAVQKIMSDYFDPLWQNSYVGLDVDVGHVMAGLTVDRDGKGNAVTYFAPVC